MAGALKLRAVDADDVAVLSAVLQDALVPVAEMAFLPDEQRFVLVVNRFRWEPGEGRRARLRAQLRRGSASTRSHGCSGAASRRADHDRILALLALRAEDGALYLEFAGGSSIRLDVERIACRLDDLGEPWPTPWRPRHTVGEDQR